MLVLDMQEMLVPVFTSHFTEPGNQIKRQYN